MKKVKASKKDILSYSLSFPKGRLDIEFTEDLGAIDIVSIIWFYDNDEINVKPLFDQLEFLRILDYEVIYDQCYQFTKASGGSPSERNRIFKNSMDNFLARRGCD